MLPSSATIALLVTVFILAGIYIAVQDALEASLTASYVPVEIRSIGYGILGSVNGVGDFVSSLVVGFLWTAFSPVIGFGFAAVVADGISTLFELWSGWFSDRIGKRKGLAVAGYAITAFSKATFALATSWWHVLFGRTFGWIGWSIRSPVRDALLTESTTPATISRAFAFHRTMDTLGQSSDR